jgi:hypothetical protein
VIWVSRLLRIGVLLASLAVLSGIVPISLAQFRTGDACPNLGPIPACHIVSLAYFAMALAVSIGWRKFKWLFFVGAAPVILLAITGTTLELSGRPTCPRSEGGWPLCYTSLTIGLSLLAAFVGAVLGERKSVADTATSNT